MRVRMYAAAIVCLFLASASRSLPAQGLSAGSFEASANGGITDLNGVDDKKGHGSFGFGLAYNVNRHFAAGAEYSYLMLGSLTESGLTENENLQLYGVGLRVTPVSNRFVAPYVLLSGGANRLHATASAGNASASASQNGGYVSAGGGVTFFVGRGFGVRPEYRYERQQLSSTTVDGIPISGGGTNDMRATIALFYQFGAPAPKPYSRSK